MITRDYCILMARYNAWQNGLLFDLMKDMDPAEITKTRAAFFGTILRTLNHILWADKTWLSRLTDDPAPEGGEIKGVEMHPTLASWSADRFRTDGRLKLWARDVSNVDLAGDLSFFAAPLGKDVTRPMALCVAHLFTHQAHHRGQVHDMLTQAGADTPLSDLFFMPEDA